MKKQKRLRSPSANVYNIFSQRLVYAMDVREMRTQMLADQVFVSRSTISDYRIGHRFPNIEQLFLLSVSLQVSTDFLLGLSDDFPFET